METGEYKIYGYRWIALAVFALVQASIQVLWSSLLPITSEAAQFYGVSALMIGLLSMLFMFVYVFVSLPSSWAISAFGVRKGMGFGVVLMGVFGLVRGFFGHDYTIVLIATVMLSIAQPFIINSITTMSARWFPVHERATATGIAMLAQFIGIMGGMAVSPILAGSLGIKTMLTWYGVLAFTALVLFFPIVSEILRRVGLPWVVTLGNYSELWRQKAEVWIQSKMKEEDFDPVATRAAHEALLQELEKTTNPKTMAAWERLMGILKK